MRVLIVLALVAGGATAAAQTPDQTPAGESRVHADLRRESNDLKGSCGGGFDLKGVGGCAYTLATDDPFHLAFGSIAPGNGTAFGLAFVEHSTPNEQWRIGWNADAVITPGGSYRAGLYVKLVRTPTSTGGGIVVRRPGDPGPPTRPAGVAIREYPIFNLYAQTIRLDTVPLVTGGGTFVERQTIAGGGVVYPLDSIGVMQPLRMSIVGALNGRFVTTSSADPTLIGSANFAQLEEDVRFRPALFDGGLRLTYLAGLQQFATSSGGSFHRWTVDLQHTIPLSQTVSSTGPVDANGPDDCGQAVGARCAQPSVSSNRQGSIGFRILASRSAASAGNDLPFYFQPTLGGSDINGQRLLSAYDDYQFRGANLFALQESVEHSLWGPIGVYALAEQGAITPEGAGLTTTDLLRSFGIGVTVRAGGFPLINFTFAWGGGHHHAIATIDPTLSGGSSRPSLY